LITIECFLTSQKNCNFTAGKKAHEVIYFVFIVLFFMISLFWI